MKRTPRATLILGILFGYVLLQFLWWEILLVRQNNAIISEKQKLAALASTDAAKMERDIAALQKKKRAQTYMIVGEGTVFLLLLLYGLHRIRQAQEKELALNRQQKNFFLSITHELKTPIAATKLQLQTLQKQKLDESTRMELLRKALEETERLNALIDNVLLASSLESGEFTFRKEKQDISSLIDAVCHRYYRHYIEKGQLKTDIAPGVAAEVDGQAFTSVITNLIDNAIKYSPGEPDILVSVELQGGRPLMTVRDQGAGIKSEDKGKIFTRFYRGGNELTRSSKGTGLGLFIVDYIARMHGAEVSVRDNRPRGSIFEIRLNG
jgi:signal transduction histidine kinase